MAYDVRLERLEAKPTLVIKGVMRVDELPAFFGEAFGQLFSYATSKGVTPDDMPFARYPSMVTPERVEVEAGIALPQRVDGEGRIEASELPAGDAAVTTHIGPYDTMQPAYDALMTWMSEHGREAGEGPWEVYFSDPQAEPDPAKWRTDIVWPLR